MQKQKRVNIPGWDKINGKPEPFNPVTINKYINNADVIKRKMTKQRLNQPRQDKTLILSVSPTSHLYNMFLYF